MPNVTRLHWAQQRYALVGSDVVLCCVVLTDVKEKAVNSTAATAK